MIQSRPFYAAALLVFISACSTQATIEPYPAITADAQVLVEMASTRKTASENKQLTMYVLGANWCHDSVDFATLLDDPQVSPLISQRYQVQYINVGNLEHIEPFVTPYSVPIIYVTPTVMVVDPVSNRLLNHDSTSYWGNASIRKPADAYDYFQQFDAADLPATATTASAALQKAQESIDQFEAQQAQRLYKAYAVLGEMMAKLDAKNPSAEFGASWGNVANMRGAMIQDLQSLREEAAAQDAAGVSDIKLDFPSYSLFTD
jgi:hypothetical protein